jgi:hypothetical protein
MISEIHDLGDYIISEIHDLGDYISASSGEAPVEARDATEDRLGNQYRVFPYMHVNHSQ